MKYTTAVLGTALAIGGATMVTPPAEVAAAAANSVCQFYKGEPLCKTIEEKNCVGVSAGIEGETCRTVTEYWYWS